MHLYKIRRFIRGIFSGRRHSAAATSVIQSSDGPTSIFIVQKKKSKKKKKQQAPAGRSPEELLKDVNYTNRTIYDLIPYLKERWNAVQVPLSNHAKDVIKSDIIMNEMPELLTVRIPELPRGQTPDQELLQAYAKAMDARFEEAMNYPSQALNLDIRRFEFPVYRKHKIAGTCRVDLEMTNDIIDIVFLDTSTKVDMDFICRDILFYRGLSKEDVRKQNRNYHRCLTQLQYEASLAERKKG
ncbi:hypothetical protein [Anaerolentibacter hominis]|uniref:hypothetical protein n=1 Tax=Anaerolentibacter hominis TaxID=3079009 RepID=UPI0031B87F23